MITANDLLHFFLDDKTISMLPVHMFIVYRQHYYFGEMLKFSLSVENRSGNIINSI